MKRFVIFMMLCVLSLNTSAQGGKGLVAHWNLNGNTKDVSGNGLHGTINGTVRAANGYNNHYNTAMQFYADSGGITIAYDSLLNLDSFSICALIKPLGFRSKQCQLSFIAGRKGAHPYSVGITDNAEESKVINHVPPCNIVTPSAERILAANHGSVIPNSKWLVESFINADTWYCVTVTYNGDSLKIYLDTVLSTVAHSTDAYGTGTDSFTIGYCGTVGDSSVNDGQFNGLIDDIMLYSRALTGDEVKQYYYTVTMPYSSSLDSLLSTPGTTFSQVLDSVAAYMDLDDTAEGGQLTQFNIFQSFWQDRVTQNDFSGYNMFQQYAIAARQAVAARAGQSCNGAWSCIGPFNLEKQQVGKVNVVWVDPDDSDHILAGTEGGLFETKQHGGANWNCLTDNANLGTGAIGITGIAVNPLNKNTIYLGTAILTDIYQRVTYVNEPGASILKTYDGGSTWLQESIENTGLYKDQIEGVNKIFITPDSTRLYAFWDDKIYTRPNVGTGNTWRDITPFDPRGTQDRPVWYNLQFVPGDPTHFFVSSGQFAEKKDDSGTTFNHSHIWESTVSAPNPSGWNNITANLTATLGNLRPIVVGPDQWDMFDISVPIADTLFAIGIAAANHAVQGLFKYNISGSPRQWTRLNKALPAFKNPTDGTFSLIASPAATSNNNNWRNIYFGTDIPYQSYDNGYSFQPIGTYAPQAEKDGHADIRSMCLQLATNTLHGVGDRLFLGTDGGVSKKPANYNVDMHGDNTTIDISGNGLTCGTFWGLATSEAGGMALGGMQHDGIMSYEPDKNPKWENLINVDACTANFDKNDPTQGYTLSGHGFLEFDKTTSRNGRVMDTITNPGYFSVSGNDSGETPPHITSNLAGQQYIGTGHFWKQASSTSVFNNNTSTYLLPTNIIHALALSPYYGDYVGYILYATLGRLYYIDPAGHTTPRANMPDQFSYPISNVTLDPVNTERVWLSQGGINNSNGASEHRALYSPDAGATWIDISNGLPNQVPVSKIIYEEGSNVLFCSTDAGVYRCDFNTFNSDSNQAFGDHYKNTSVVWECFSKGAVGSHDFPNAWVTDLNINYCQGKLYAATYGRSIWSTDIYGFDEFPVTQPNIIDASTTWSTDKYITNDVKITAGHTLTISHTTVHMPRNGHIIVEPGAKLVVDTSTITNDCSGCMWYGIEVLGNTWSPQTVDNQGWVVMKNSVLENARSAVMNWDRDANNAGGIIQAFNDTFLNNRRSAEFGPYHNAVVNYGTGAVIYHSNRSYFMNCVFKVDDNYRGDGINYPFYSMIDMSDVEGIQIEGCQFMNQKTFGSAGIGTGIGSYNAGFRVVPYCGSPALPFSCLSPVRNTFTGFRAGISIGGDQSTPPPVIEIDQADFDKNGVGVYDELLNSTSITRSTFHVGDGLPIADIVNYTGTCYESIGIYTKSANYFTIEEDSFLYASSGLGGLYATIGVLNEHTGPNDKRVYRSYFDGLNYGCYAVGENGSGIPPKGIYNTLPGLSYECNIFKSNIGIYVDGTNPDGTHNNDYGVKRYIGGNAAAGNKFMSSNFINTGYPIEYIYKPGTDALPTSSSGIRTSTVTADNSCISSFNKNLAFGTSPVQINGDAVTFSESGYVGAQINYTNAVSAYTALYDGGSTDDRISHLSDIAGNVSSLLQSDSIYHYLQPYSPYLSQQVLLAAGHNSNLSSSHYVELLLDNPENLRDLAFMDSIQNSIAIAISIDNMNTLNDSANNTNARSTYERDISSYHEQAAACANTILMGMRADSDPDPLGRTYNDDSTSENYLLDENSVYQFDSLATWLINVNEVNAAYDLIGYYRLNEESAPGLVDNVSLASYVLTNIVSGFPLTDSQIVELSDYQIVFDNLPFSLSDIGSLSSGNISALTAIAQGHSANKAQVVAGSALDNHAQISSRIPCLATHYSDARKGRPDDKQPIKNTPGAPVDQLKAGKQFSVYPNPAKDNVIFTYAIPTLEDATLTISNTLGATVQQYILKDKAGTIMWDVHTITPGVYLYQLKDGSSNYTGKIVITQ